MDACREPWDLFSPEFQRAVERFARPAPGTVMEGEDGYLWTYSIPNLAFLGNHYPIVRIAGGAYLIRGEIDSSDRGAIIISATGRIQAIGLLTDQAPDESYRRDLDIFVRPGSQGQAWIPEVRKWAAGELADWRRWSKRNQLPAKPRPLRRARVHFVAGG